MSERARKIREAAVDALAALVISGVTITAAYGMQALNSAGGYPKTVSLDVTQALYPGDAEFSFIPQDAPPQLTRQVRLYAVCMHEVAEDYPHGVIPKRKIFYWANFCWQMSTKWMR